MKQHERPELRSSRATPKIGILPHYLQIPMHATSNSAALFGFQMTGLALLPDPDQPLIFLFDITLRYQKYYHYNVMKLQVKFLKIYESGNSIFLFAQNLTFAVVLFDTVQSQVVIANVFYISGSQFVLFVHDKFRIQNHHPVISYGHEPEGKNCYDHDRPSARAHRSLIMCDNANISDINGPNSYTNE